MIESCQSCPLWQRKTVQLVREYQEVRQRMWAIGLAGHPRSRMPEYRELSTREAALWEELRRRDLADRRPVKVVPLARQPWEPRQRRAA